MQAGRWAVEEQNWQWARHPSPPQRPVRLSLDRERGSSPCPPPLLGSGLGQGVPNIERRVCGYPLYVCSRIYTPLLHAWPLAGLLDCWTANLEIDKGARQSKARVLGPNGPSERPKTNWNQAQNACVGTPSGPGSLLGNCTFGSFWTHFETQLFGPRSGAQTGASRRSRAKPLV